MYAHYQCPRCEWKSPYTMEKCINCGYFLNTVDVRSIQELQFRVGRIEMVQTIKNNNKTMSINSMMKRLLDSNTQTLVKAGYINGDLELTEKGKNALWAILFDANKASLVSDAQSVLDEEKKK